MAVDLQRLYDFRFDEASVRAKQKIWAELCTSFFQPLVDPRSVVVDVASGFGEFINNIKAAEKHGVDANPAMARYLNSDVRFHCCPADQVPEITNGSVDLIFMSNFLEHLPNKAALESLLAECRRMLKPGGRMIIMGPNIRYLPGAYWDFYDHHLPLSHASLAEGLHLAGFELVRVIDRFLPYTTRSRLPQHPFLVRLYLRFPVLWRILGKQFLVIARKP